ncbi:MAG: SDR family NAD(P)-dependent oxidoreductase [Smithellaceae bacterium]|nr:SDR family NAD(P)-dependent oxidoreductase [Smithellaceae bacterium]
MYDLAGKTALITGSGKRSGMGFGMAESLAACGANVIISDLGIIPADKAPSRTSPTEEMSLLVDELARRFKVQTLAVTMDVTDNNSITAAVETIKERFPRVDILCNNAGASFGVPNTVLTYDEADWIRTVEVNLMGVFRVSRSVIPLMLGKPAVIINNASRAGKVPPIFNSAYAVAKAGVIMLTKTMAKELAPSGIRVNAICPGQIRTDLSRWRFELEARFFKTTAEEREREMCQTIPLGYIGDIKDVGNLVAFLAADESRYITGQAINLDGGQCMEL